MCGFCMCAYVCVLNVCAYVSCVCVYICVCVCVCVCAYMFCVCVYMCVCVLSWCTTREATWCVCCWPCSTCSSCPSLEPSCCGGIITGRAGPRPRPRLRPRATANTLPCRRVWSSPHCYYCKLFPFLKDLVQNSLPLLSI